MFITFKERSIPKAHSRKPVFNHKVKTIVTFESDVTTGTRSVFPVRCTRRLRGYGRPVRSACFTKVNY